MIRIESNSFNICIVAVERDGIAPSDGTGGRADRLEKIAPPATAGPLIVIVSRPELGDSQNL